MARFLTGRVGMMKFTLFLFFLSTLLLFGTGCTKPTALVTTKPQLDFQYSEQQWPAEVFYERDQRKGVVFDTIPFDNYTVRTRWPKETAQYLPIWKEVFQKLNNIDESYFQDHVRVIETSVLDSPENLTLDGKREKTFFVTYHYEVDWAKLEVTDRFPFAVEGVATEMTAQELLRDMQLPPENREQKKFSGSVHYGVYRLEPITAIVSKDQIISAVRQASTSMQFSFDINRDLEIDSFGRLIIRLHGVSKFDSNQCGNADLIVSTAAVINISEERPCRIE